MTRAAFSRTRLKLGKKTRQEDIDSCEVRLAPFVTNSLLAQGFLSLTCHRVQPACAEKSCDSLDWNATNSFVM
jgi:hypothetical protein